MLENKVILIAGGSGGIGQDLSKLCIEQKARVYIGYNKNEHSALKLAREINATAILFDLSNRSSMEEALKIILSENKKIDGFVNCAGIHYANPLVGLTDSEILEQIEINLTGAIIATQIISKQMIAQRSGSIVMIGSVSAHRMKRGHSVYSATKKGLEGFVEALAAEVAKRGIRINTVVPGPVLTPMLQKTIDETGVNPAEDLPIGRLIEAREVANACAYLLGDLSKSVTGTSLLVDGGYVLW